MIDEFITVIFLTFAATLRVATPLILCAMGGLFCEKSGIIDVGLEGKMLMAAFFGYLTGFALHGADRMDAAGVGVPGARQWPCCMASPASPIAAIRW